MLAMILGGGEIVVVMLALGLVCLGLLAFAFWIWMLIDCIKNENISGNERLVWVLVIVLTHALGALIYFCAGRARRSHPLPPPLPGQ